MNIGSYTNTTNNDSNAVLDRTRTINNMLDINLINTFISEMV